MPNIDGRHREISPPLILHHINFSGLEPIIFEFWGCGVRDAFPPQPPYTRVSCNKT